MDFPLLLESKRSPLPFQSTTVSGSTARTDEVSAHNLTLTVVHSYLRLFDLIPF